MYIKYPVLLCLLLAGLLTSGQNTRISTFRELMKSLEAGDQVRVVIHYHSCVRAPGNQDNSPIPEATTGMIIDTFEHFAPGAAHNKNAFVVFSSSKLIQNPKGKGFVYNYGKVRINEDDTVQITAKYVHPKTFKVLMDEVFFGRINTGINNEGIELFSVR